jgi:hypothetical protein
VLKRFSIAVVSLALILSPAFGAEQVTGTPASTPNAQRAQQTNSAVVEKNISSTTITVPASTEPQEFHIDVKPLIDGLLPYIISALGGVIVILGGLLTAWLKQKFNIDIEAKQREAWQQTATNAAGALIAKGAVSIEQQTGKITIHSEAMADVINTASERVPEAIRALGITPEQMAQTITAKVPQVLTGSTPAAAVGKA